MSSEWIGDVLNAGWETLYMVLASGSVALAAGLPLGVLLFVTRHPSFSPHPYGHRVLGFFVNGLRSVPFIILMVAIIPLTRWIAGTSIGTTAAIVPLSLAAIPFMARMVENNLSEVPHGLIEAGLSMGATPWQIICHILLPEASFGLIQSMAMTLINLVAYSAMAGAIGGGGLGDLAIRYGYQRFDTRMMLITLVLLVLGVQAIQQASDWLIKKVHHN